MSRYPGFLASTIVADDGQADTRGFVRHRFIYSYGRKSSFNEPEARRKALVLIYKKPSVTAAKARFPAGVVGRCRTDAVQAGFIIVPDFVPGDSAFYTYITASGSPVAQGVVHLPARCDAIYGALSKAAASLEANPENFNAQTEESRQTARIH